MRKKTENEDLARRAKKLVKKWQKLVSNHFKNLSKGADVPKTGNGTKLPTNTQLNGLIKENDERPKSCTDIQPKTGLKRKRTSISAQSSPLSERDLAKIDANKKRTIDVQKGPNLVDNDINFDTRNSVQNGQHSTNTQLESKEPNVIVNVEGALSNSLSTQEDQADADDNQDDEWVAVAEDSVNPTPALVPCPGSPEPASDIPEEDLVVKRRELPEDIIDPMSEADGINGCYSQDGTWCQWSDTVSQNNSNLLILPYVILE